MQQSYENQPSFNQIEVLNISCEKEKELLLLLILEEILIADSNGIEKGVDIIAITIGNIID